MEGDLSSRNLEEQNELETMGNRIMLRKTDYLFLTIKLETIISKFKTYYVIYRDLFRKIPVILSHFQK